MSDVHDRIAADIKANDVLLYMKGTPVFPQCGFSAAVVGILSELGVKFKAVDVLKDPEVRQGIKEFSNWPTIPQLYVKGEFVGGCDIVTEMTLSGELDTLFDQKGVGYNKEAAAAKGVPRPDSWKYLFDDGTFHQRMALLSESPSPRAMSCSAGQKPDFSRRVGSVFDAARLLMSRNTGAFGRALGRNNVTTKRCSRPC